MKILRTGSYEYLKDLPLTVDWILTKRCNYRCSYCFQYGKGKNPPPQLPFSTLEQLQTAADNIASLNRPWYNFTLTGGELTTHPHISGIISMLHETFGERINRIEILTNGSRNSDFYKKLASFAKSHYVILSNSIHTDHVDMNHILEHIKNLSEDINISFILMFNPAKREMVHEIYETLFEYRKKYIFEMCVFFIRVGTNLDPRYTEEDFTWQKEANSRFKALEESVNLPTSHRKKIPHPENLFHQIEDNGVTKIFENTDRTLKESGFFNFSGMYCMANTASLRIEENGLCKGLVCEYAPYICNLFEKDALIAIRDRLIHALKCPVPMCGCSANYRVPKFASEEEAKKYLMYAHNKQNALFDEYTKAHTGNKLCSPYTMTYEKFLRRLNP